MSRRKTRIVYCGKVKIGGNAPISIQSMTKTDTRDAAATISQIKEIEKAGCDIIRVAVPDEIAAKAIVKIKKGIKIPLVADIHFNYKLALLAIDAGADKIRINPGNIGEEWKVKEILSAAKSAKIPIRIGLNAGSIEKYAGKKRHETAPVIAAKLVAKAAEYVRFFEKNNFYQTVISLKASDTMTTVEAYRKMAKLCDYPFHLGVTEAGTAITGTVKSSVGLGIMLNEGLGDTLRVSLAAEPTEEVKVGREILKALGLRKNESDLVVCPTCGRCEVDIFGMAKKVEDEMLKLKKPLKIAVMGCVVNGPGEAAEADLGLAGGKKAGLIFKNGKIIKKVPEKHLLREFIKELKKTGQVKNV
ncbi:MAG: 4-hydroxy-3-methylbut-2-en-1-yl diphosphate synthase [Candidatus Firestonebacteria bacterium RIFOXYA2_FULL_40_8]|nr:MAG: 4-hydroxy-3-methylbut-2-en-1-yl diphosphate synthase [Candidatus Firestonebacteria bacterium RIFOXYA2_FULL_40_8]